ncbi:MAG: methylmalonyl Co-A mutase-associated GTPase MeaB [Magnetococcales bacterium]|nr:methylmalonyl Co-A mutase-associated GTPase MeaB [Magnetococcales bacterium]MBF0149775.1 methylmalonyl Co-A mutase-associated GTPase MeaB [Magnetococcales bacterium]MBF0173097.1 methylmalonyl Co-A mutase-associated GTPase MeaB [Magnetococcales bacterium]MBF0347042.1 methylmalonyl Co-A mutase-associated GTPase MeaB [Magnetococcales bacterium]MBF0630178.1 methylmalonyl Co-A mutase-associated GTPase MeaB [Magnetococcales bacterium]
MPRFDTETYVQGVLQGDRRMIAKAITLIESTLHQDEEQTQEIIGQLLPYCGKSLRIGITGPPGAGKSTMIEALGLHLLKNKRRIAILAVDPSSKLSGGSVLGDKTRMGRLMANNDIFVRPSAAGETLGGVARKTRETMLVLEAAGFDTVLVETVGVGQSETVVADMTDFFLLVALPNAGDELQGIKRGIMEMADAIVVNKADGPFEDSAKQAAHVLRSALQVMHHPRPDWELPVFLASARTGLGIDEIWKSMLRFQEVMMANGVLQSRRREQNLEWMTTLVREELERRFDSHPEVQYLMPDLRRKVSDGRITAVRAASMLMQAFAVG